ncbi:MAG: transposase, partial [Planctomycetaceae bacterium]
GRHDLAERMQLAEAVLNKRIEKQAEKKGGKRKSLEKITVSLSDPVAPLGRDKMKVFRPMYTVQCVMDEASMMVLGYSCDAVVTDSGTLIPMIEKTQKIVGGRLKTILADSAYCSTLDILGCRDLGVNLISPVQANSFTEKKERAKTDRQIPRDQFRFDAAQNSYECPAGHKLAYTGRDCRGRVCLASQAAQQENFDWKKKDPQWRYRKYTSTLRASAIVGTTHRDWTP